MYFLNKMYQKVIISIDLNLSMCKILIDYHNTNKKEEKVFKTINGDMPIEAIKYIRKIKSKYPFTYISSMVKIPNQGLLLGNKIDVFNKFDINPKTILAMLINKSWFIYVDKIGIQQEKSKFNKIYGIDFLFSPFVIIYERIKKQLEDINKLYILQGKYTCTLLIANKNAIYFGRHVVIEDGFFEEKEITNSNEQKNEIEFNALNDIDENIIIKDFDDKSNININDAVSNLSDLNIANNITLTIKNVLNDFYNDTRYKSDFIEELLILDGYGISDNIISQLKKHIMLDVRLLQIDFCEEILKLSKLELKL